MRVPAALIAIPLLIGSAIGLLIADRPDPSLALNAAAASLLALLAGASLAGEDRPGECATAVAIGALSAGVSLGVSDARRAYHAPLAEWAKALPPGADAEPVELTGRLREDASGGGQGVSIALDVVTARSLDGGEPVTAGGGVRLSFSAPVSSSQLAALRAGRSVRLPAILRLPTSYRNPGFRDESRALARRGISLVGTVKSAALVEVVAQGGVFEEAAAVARAWTRMQLARYVGARGGPAGAITTAVLIGDRTGLPDEDERRLQEAGTYHVIAISGGNIAILTALLLGAARLSRIPSRAAAVVASAALVFYGLVAGGGASVARAVTAAVIYLLGRVLEHRGPALNALSMAAVAALGQSAVTAFDAGFILSFGATLGILLGGPRLFPRASRDGTAWRTLVAAAATMVLATACAEIVLAPAGAVIFSRITFAGLLLNVAAIPLMTVAQASALLTLCAASISPAVAGAAGYVAHVSATLLVDSARLVDMAPWLSRAVPPPSWWLVIVYYAACAMALLAPRMARHALGAAAGCLGLMLLAPPVATATFAPARPASSVRLVFIDVGQGDATAVVFPSGRALLVDAGGSASSSFDVGARVVAPTLRALGVRALETLVITHADPDHVGGAASIVRAFDPRSLWEGVPVPHDASMRALGDLMTARRASWRIVQAGDLQREGSVEIRVLHPPPPDWERQRVRNDDSVVLEIRMGEVSIVLPGDIERAAEQIVLPRIALAPLTILKAPHHGSATSSTAAFLQAVHPRAVIFSAGQNNRFGHPAPAVVTRYAAAGVPMFNTATDGAVILDTDGKAVQISGWASGRRLRVER